MNEFIATCPFEGAGARAEEIVWEKLKEALKEEEVLAYYQYPLFAGSEECKRQPDILIFHRQWGIMIIEVKGLEMKQIKKVRGGQWEVKGYFDKPYINPGKQAEKQLEVLMKKFTDRKLVGKIPVKIAVAVPYIEKKEWVGKGVVLEDQPLLFKDEMGPKTLKQWLRGIAGSGKTILLCQRAVHMHLKHPDWKIAIVFQTKSLYNSMTRYVKRYMESFTEGEQTYNPDGNLQILHAWGGRWMKGLYSEICKANRIKALTVRHVKGVLTRRGKL